MTKSNKQIDYRKISYNKDRPKFQPDWILIDETGKILDRYRQRSFGLKQLKAIKGIYFDNKFFLVHREELNNFLKDLRSGKNE